jgi:16S rRNA processing protein RimM
MITKDEIIEIGKFQKTHALKGELNALLDVDEDYAADGNPLIVEMDGIFVPFYAESVRPKGSESCLVKLKDVDSQELAQQFVNKNIYALRSELVNYYDVPEDEIVADFVGFKIVDRHIGEVGTVADIDDTTANVLFVVNRPDGSTVLIPVADEFIESIDTDAKLIYTSLPDGLIEM